MVEFVVDKSLDVLLKQLNDHAPNRSKASDGSIGDAAHASRDSAHNPQDTEDSQDHNDPDHQVDARDFTHDPAHGADMADFTEQLRVSRDERLYLVIFNHRQFSSYARDGHPPFTWRPYSGSDPHTGHAHVEVNDYHNDDTRPWRVYEMSALTEKQIGDIHYAMFTNSGETPTPRPPKSVTGEIDSLLVAVADLKSQINALALVVRDIASDVDALTIPQPAPVDPAALQPVVESGVRAVLKAGVDQA